MMSLGCVLENMWLVAQSLGLGFQVISFLSGAFSAGLPSKKRSKTSSPLPTAWKSPLRSVWVIPSHQAHQGPT